MQFLLLIFVGYNVTMARADHGIKQILLIDRSDISLNSSTLGQRAGKGGRPGLQWLSLIPSFSWNWWRMLLLGNIHPAISLGAQCL